MKAMTTTKFDYAKAPVELMKLTSEIRDHFKSSTRGLLEIGTRLIEAKAMLEHGKFHEWLGTEFGLSERTAQNMMAAAAYCKSAKFADMEVPASALYLLAADTTPEDVRERFTSRIQAGELVTHKEVATAVQHVKATRVKPTTPTHTPAGSSEVEMDVKHGTGGMIEDEDVITTTTALVQLAEPDQLEGTLELGTASGARPAQDDSTRPGMKASPERPAADLAHSSAPVEIVRMGMDGLVTGGANLLRHLEALSAAERSGLNATAHQLLQIAQATVTLTGVMGRN